MKIGFVITDKAGGTDDKWNYYSASDTIMDGSTYNACSTNEFELKYIRKSKGVDIALYDWDKSTAKVVPLSCKGLNFSKLSNVGVNVDVSNFAASSCTPVYGVVTVETYK